MFGWFRRWWNADDIDDVKVVRSITPLYPPTNDRGRNTPRFWQQPTPLRNLPCTSHARRQSHPRHPTGA